MRAKNELKFIAEAYNTKLILERVVDGKLMCPDACCGAPVVECTCGPDCPHCNCFMIHKAMKSKGFTDKLLKEFYKMRDPDGDGSWPDDDDDRDHPDWGEPEYGDRGTGEYGEDEERITDVFYQYVDKIEQDIYNGMTFKESMISNKIDPSHWNNLLDIYTEYMEDKTEGPFETGFEDNEGWGRVAKGALLGSLGGIGAVTGGLAGAAYHALKGKTPKKKEKKEDKGFSKGGW